MSGQPLAILKSGLVCGVGLDAPSACAAIRCAIDNFQETRFMDKGGEWIIGSSVPLEQPWRGRTKLLKMAAMAVRECMDGIGENIPPEIPLLLCVAEHERMGRIDGLDDKLFGELERELGYRFHATDSLVIPHGRVSAAVALKHARNLIYEKQHAFVLIAGVDSLLVAPTLSALEENFRLLTSQNSNGFIPGEAGSAVLVSRPLPNGGEPQLLCNGLGFAVEEATIDAEIPLRADGLTKAIKAALLEANCELGDLDFRITDISGDQYYFKEAELALNRVLRKHKEHFYIWHPADCIGEVGAAIGPALLTIALASCQKAYAYGNHIICQQGNDAGQRAATILNFVNARVS